jgi:SUMO ligase MMS21 Smc5/6 complex component
MLFSIYKVIIFENLSDLIVQRITRHIRVGRYQRGNQNLNITKTEIEVMYMKTTIRNPLAYKASDLIYIDNFQDESSFARGEYYIHNFTKFRKLIII